MRYSSATSAVTQRKAFKVSYPSRVKIAGLQAFSGPNGTALSQHIASLCLLSRGLQNRLCSRSGSCFEPLKAMIALLFDPALLQAPCSTSQPKQQKSVFRLFRRWLNPLTERLIPQPVASRRGLNNLSTERADRHYLLRAAEAANKHPVSSSNSPDHPFHAANTSPADHLCQVCDAHCSTSCIVCDQDFCSTHLYACVECDNQYCSRCLDDHRADGHWTDSDTAAELNRGWPAMSSFGVLRVGTMDLSGGNARPVSKQRLA